MTKPSVVDRRARTAVHPVVAAYVDSDEELLTILRAAPEPRAPILEAMVRLREFLSGNFPADGALKAAEEVAGEEADPDLFILFLSTWSQVSYRLQRIPEAWALIHRARSLVSGSTPPELKAHLMANEARLENARGNKIREEELLREGIALVAADSRRRKYWVFQRAILLARQGRGTEVERDFAWLEGLGSTRLAPSRVAIARLIDCVETGRIQEAEGILPLAEQDPSYYLSTTRVRRKILDLMRGLADGEERPAEGGRQSLDQALPAGVRVLRLLLLHRVDEALAATREQFADTVDYDVAVNFLSYNLIRTELAAGNGDAARRLLEKRRARGGPHYLDSFFAARAERVLGNAPAAAHHLALVLKEVEIHRAEGRLDLELRMACELSPGDLLRLTRAAERIMAQGAPALPPPPVVGREEAAGLDRLIGKSPALASVKEAIARFAHLDVPILITGDTGTGKELVARALHEHGPRRAEPFIPVNCGAITESILETELFGHERGSFTGAERAHRGFFEEAGRGTLFLDEIGEISQRLQVALLRAIETAEVRPVGSARSRKVACRIVAATNAPLQRLVEAGRFRKDLYYRLRRLEIALPPLRERRADILPLASHFLDLGRRPGFRAAMSDDLKEALLEYGWPGNVRELLNEIERMRLVNSDKVSYALADLSPQVRGTLEEKDRGESADRAGSGEGRGAPGAEKPQAAAGRESAVRSILDQGKTAMRRLERMRELFAGYGKLTRAEIARILEISPNTATRDLKALCDEGAVERVCPSPSPRSHYFRQRGN